jgi:hypothetical protein
MRQPFSCRRLICGTIFAKNKEGAKKESMHEEFTNREEYHAAKK